MATYNDILDDVGEELGLPTYKSGGTDEARTKSALNRVLQKIRTAYPFVWNMQPVPLSIPLVAGTSNYDLSVIIGGGKILDIYSALLDTAGTDSQDIKVVTIQNFVKRFPALNYDAQGKPTHLARTGKYNVQLGPVPDSAYTLSLYYSFDPVDIVVYTNEHSFPDKVRAVLIDGMLARLYRFLREYDVARELKEDFNNGLADLIRDERDDPTLSFTRQGFRQSPNSTQYWKSPFYR